MVYNIFESLVDSAVSTLLETINRIENALETNRRLEKEFEHHVLLAFKGVGKEKDLIVYRHQSMVFLILFVNIKKAG